MLKLLSLSVAGQAYRSQRKLYLFPPLLLNATIACSETLPYNSMLLLGYYAKLCI